MYRVNIELTISFILGKIHEKMAKDTLEERIFSAKVVCICENGPTHCSQRCELVDHQLQICAAVAEPTNRSAALQPVAGSGYLR